MSEDVWRELLQSPFDDDPASGPGGTENGNGRALRFVAAGLVAGVVLAAGWLMVTRDDAVVAADGVSSGTTAASPTAAPPGWPAGYVEVADGVGARAELMYVQGDDLYVVVSTAVRSDVDPSEAETFKGGEWVVLGGTAPVAATAEVGNPQSLGVGSVSFSAAVVPPASARSLLLTPLAPRVETEHEAQYETEGLPFETTEPLRFLTDYDDAVVVIDRIAVDANVGVVDWHVAGSDTVRAQVDVVVELPGTSSGDDDPPTLLMSEHLAPPYPFQRPQKPTPSHTRGASDVLRRVGEEVEVDDAIDLIVVRFTVSVQDVLAVEPIELSLEGATIVNR